MYYVGLKKYHNGDIYEGDFENGLNHGEGKLIFGKNGNEYIGEFYEGFMHGKGNSNLRFK